MTRKRRIAGIDEELWFGTYSDAEAERKAAESVTAMVGRIVGAKPFPVAAQRLADVTRNPDCSMNDVVRVLERDVALSAKVLRLVNSASFALRMPCSSVRHAAALVGIEKLNQVATTAAILDMYDSSSVHASRILEHASVVAALCRYLAAHLGLPTDELFTIGFLHDIGKLMLLDSEPERYAELLDDVGAEFDTIHLYERELFGFDHALLAGHVLSAWSIPDPVPKVVAWHHHVTRAYDEGPQWASLVSVLRLADALSYALSVECDEAEVERIARIESASYLDISAAQLAAVWDELRTLHDRSRALFRGEEPPPPLAAVSLRPSMRSLRTPASRQLEPSHPSLIAPPMAPQPTSTPPALRSGDGKDGNTTQSLSVPQQFACIVCAGPSFAATCPACHGYACPSHLSGTEQWCDLCWQEYETDGHNWRLRPVVSLIGGAGLGATIVGAFFGAAAGSAGAQIALTLGPLVGTLLAIGLAAVVHRALRRVWFLRHRPDRNAEARSTEGSTAGQALPAETTAPTETAETSEAPDSGVRRTTQPPGDEPAEAPEAVVLERPAETAAPEEAIVPSPLIPVLRHPPRIELAYGSETEPMPAPRRATEPTLKLFTGASVAPDAQTLLDVHATAAHETEPAPPSVVPYVRPLVASSFGGESNDHVRPLIASEPPQSPPSTRSAPVDIDSGPSAQPEPPKQTPDEAWHQVLGATGTADGW